MMNRNPDIFAFEPSFLVPYLEQIANATAEDREKARGLSDDATPDNVGGSLTVAGGVAIIPILGPLSKGGPTRLEQWFGIGGTSYGKIRASLAEAEANPDVIEIIFSIDSPGGYISGVDATFQAIANCTKKTKAQVHGLCASCAYWLASAADEIVAEAPTDQIGSVGVKIAGYDVTAALKDIGFKKVVIVSQNAPDKAADLDSKKGIAVLQKEVDAIEGVFIERIAAARGVTVEKVAAEFGRGGLFIAQDPRAEAPDALKAGMIDAVGGAFSVSKNKTSSGAAACYDEFNNIIVGQEAPGTTGNPGGEGVKGAAVDALSNVGNVDEDINPSSLEGVTMTLKDLQTQNPVIFAQIETDHAAAIAAAVNKALGEANEATTKRIKAASPFLAADSTYPAPIKALAVKVINGESDESALVGAVTAYDAAIAAASGVAATTEQVPDTPATPAAAAEVPDDGDFKSNEQYMAGINKDKGGA